MTSRPLLSICIPTFNREFFLRECLASIQAEGLYDQFEVVVSDNASTDRTLDVLREFRDKLPLRWVVQDNNVGADRNFDAVVIHARGEYCWLLGSDDVLEPSTITRIITSLRTKPADILHFGYIQTDIALKQLYRAHPREGVVMTTPAGLADYLGGMANISLLFAFMSSFVFRRSIWITQHERVLGWVGTHYIHLFTMHAALIEGATLVASADCLVLARGGNSNEFNTEPGRFISLDASMVNRLITEIYGDAPSMWRALGRTFRRSYPVKALISAAANGGLHYLILGRKTLLRLGYPEVLLNFLNLLGKLRLLGAIKLGLDLRRAVLARLDSKEP